VADRLRYQRTVWPR